MSATRSAFVSILSGSARTFEVQGHRYAMVAVRGLRFDPVTVNQLLVDGQLTVAAEVCLSD